MRISVFFLLFTFLFLHQPLQAQTDRNSYRYLRNEGIKNFNAKDFETAINYFRLAEIASDTPENNDIDTWIEDSFDGYVKLLQQERDRARQAEEIAKLEAKASEMAGLAYKLGKTNPTLGLRIAEAAMQLKTNSKSAKQQFHDQVSNSPAPFYAQVLEHEKMVNCAAILASRSQVVTGSWDPELKLWSEKGELLKTLSGHTAGVLDIAVSPDEQYIASAGSDNKVILWDIQGNLLYTLEGHVGDVTSVRFAQDGQSIVTGSWDKTVKTWSLNGQALNSFQAHDHYINSVDVSPDGQYLASASWDGTGKIWTIDGTLVATLSGHNGVVTSIRFSPDGTKILTGSWDSSLRLWDLEGKPVQSFIGHEESVEAVEFMVDGNLILSCSEDRTIRLWNTNGNELQVFKYHQSIVKDIFVAPSVPYFVSASFDKQAVLWYYKGVDLTEYAGTEDGNQINDIAYSSQGDYLLVGHSGGLLNWFSPNLELIREDTTHDADILSVAISPDGQWAASGDRNERIYLWNAEGELVDTLEGHEGDVYSMKFTPDGTKLVSGDLFGKLLLWNLQGDTLVSFLGHEERVYDLDISPDGKLIVSASRDGTIRLWDMQGNEQQSFIGHNKKWVRAVSFSPDGQNILSGGSDAKAGIWDLKGNKQQSFEGHERDVFSVGYAADGQYIFTGGVDENIKIWDLEGSELQTYSSHTGVVEDGVYTDKEKAIYSGGINNVIKKWMPWWSFINSERVYQLNNTEREEYGLELLAEEEKEEANTASETDTEEKPRLSPTPPSQLLTNLEKDLRKNPNITNEYFVSMHYGKKAYASQHPLERIHFQDRSIEKAEWAFSQYSRPPNSDNLSILAYYYVNLAIWQLANQQPEEALATAKKGLSLEFTTVYRPLLSAKTALVYWLNGQEEKAKSALKDTKALLLSEVADFRVLHAYTTNEVLEKDLPIRELLLMDVEYLKQSGFDPPQLSAFEEELIIDP